jgi:hypothetical protein
MTATPEEHVDEWVGAMANPHDYATRDPGDARTAERAVANLWSAYGYQDTPTTVLRMLVQAVEIGSASAIRDTRDGKDDAEIELRRPELSGP